MLRYGSSVHQPPLLHPAINSVPRGEGLPTTTSDVLTMLAVS